MEALQSQMHTLMQCFNDSHGSSSTSTSVPPNSGQYSLAAHIAGTAFSLSSSVQIPHNVWVLDTEATNHMCCNSTYMSNITALSEPLTVKFPNGQDALVTHRGSVYLHLLSVTITYVLFVPSFTFNLLSVSKLSSQIQSIIHFTSTSCYVQD